MRLRIIWIPIVAVLSGCSFPNETGPTPLPKQTLTVRPDTDRLLIEAAVNTHNVVWSE